MSDQRHARRSFAEKVLVERELERGSRGQRVGEHLRQKEVAWERPRVGVCLAHPRDSKE